MYYSRFLMGMVVISSISNSSHSMVTDKKKPRKTIQVVRVQVTPDREFARQLHQDQAELITAFFSNKDVFSSLLRPRL